MDRTYRVIALATLILSIISLVWEAYDIYNIHFHLTQVLQFKYPGAIMAIGYIFILLFHISAFLFIFMRIRRTGKAGKLPILIIMTGIASLFSIAIEKVMFDEIGREFYIEFPISGEILFLYVCLGINALFSALIIFCLYREYMMTIRNETPEILMDEKIFSLVQLFGIVSGIMGLLLTCQLIVKEIPLEKFWIYIPFYLLFLTPYILAAAYWLLMKGERKISAWYDEKQLCDILKASLATLLISIPGFIPFLFIQGQVCIYWYPYYLFMVLLLFSGNVLYFFKSA